MNLIASLKRYNQVDPKRIGLLGHSLGGHVALRTLVVSKDVKATVMMSGVVGSLEDLIYSWRRTPASSGIATAVRGARQALIEKYGDPKANPEFWNSASAITYVDAVTGAVQVHHSEGDSVVPLLFSTHLTEALQKAGKPVEEFVYPGDDHQFIQSRRFFLQRTVAFYQAKL